MMDAYKRANEALHPPASAVERAVRRAAAGARPRKKRRPLRAVIPAGVAAALAAVLLVNGVPGLGGGGITASAAYALAEPAYPDLPHMPGGARRLR